MVKIISDVGYCFGVLKTIETLKLASKENDKVYLLHPLLHNIEENTKLMEENNALYLNELKDDKNKKGLLFSAHGYMFEQYNKYKDKFNLYIGTCPLILKRYEILKKKIEDITYIYLGKKDHQETISFLNNFPFLNFIDTSIDFKKQVDKFKIDNNKIFIIPQTTISLTSLNNLLNLLSNLNYQVTNLTICENYYSRIKEIDSFLKKYDGKCIIFVIGDKLSSNANEILNFIKNKYSKYEVYIENNINEIKKHNLENKDIFLTSPTSTSIEKVNMIKKEIENYL